MHGCPRWGGRGMAVDTTYRRERPPLATAGLLRRHIQPVEFLFDPMKGIVTDLVARTHRNDGLPRGTQRRPMQFALRRTGAGGGRIGEARSEFLPHEVRDWRPAAV